MGGTKKTKEDLLNELGARVLNSANQELEKVFRRFWVCPSEHTLQYFLQLRVPPQDDLKKALEILAARQFEKVFGYAYTDTKPPNANGAPSVLQNLASMETPDQADVYIRDVVMK